MFGIFKTKRSPTTSDETAQGKDIETREQETTQYEGKIAELQKTIEALEDRHKSAISFLREENVKKELKHTENLAAMSKLNDELKEKFQSAQDDLEQFKQHRKEQEENKSDLLSLREECARKESKHSENVAALSKLNDELKEKFQFAQENLEQNKSDLSSLREEYVRKESNYTENVVVLSKLNDDLTEKFQSAQVDLEQSRKEQMQAKSDLSSLREECARMKSEHSENIAALNKLNEELIQDRGSIPKIEASDIDINRLKAEIAQKDAEIAHQREENARLIAMLAANPTSMTPVSIDTALLEKKVHCAILRAWADHTREKER